MLVGDAVITLTVKIDARDAIADLRRKMKDRSADFNRAFTREVAAIYAETQREVPRRTGALADSGSMTSDTTKRGILRLVISYTASYARWVHERDLNYRVGKWKFVEDPVRKMAPGIPSRIAASMKK